MQPQEHYAHRRQAMERHREGESPSAICTALGYSRAWFYKWLGRYRAGGDAWFHDQPRSPHRRPSRTALSLEDQILTVRRSLESQGLFHGDQAISWELEDLGLHPPSIRTIARILARHGRTRRRGGRYRPKGKRYPGPPASGPGVLHQTDFVGPRYLHGPIRFYSLNTIDIHTRRCAVEPVLRRDAQRTIEALWATWRRLGMPRHQQVDNEAVFYGSPTHPRGMGSLIRLCLHYDIEPWFIPPAEPWRNGVVEKFNDHWKTKFFRRITLHSAAELGRESLRFEARHNGRYRYSALGGKTPHATLQASGVRLRFPPTPAAPHHPLPKPEHGRYHLVRFVRSDSRVNVFGEQFHTPPEAVYEYVRLTIDVARQRLSVYLLDTVIDEHRYLLR